jgi:predicted dehydrogenase
VLGEVYNVESRVYGSRGIPGDWRKLKKCGGGMVFDWGVHLIDQALMFAQDRKLLSVYATLDKVFGGECDDGFSVCFKFEGDLTYLCEVRTNNYIQMPRWYVVGKDGTLVLKDWSCDGEIVRKVKEDAEAKPIAASSGMTKTMAPRAEATIEHLPIPEVDVTVADFFLNVKAAIRGEEKQNITAEQLLATTEIMEAMFRSAKTNTVITEFEFQK